MRARPTVSYHVELPPEAVLDRFAEMLESPGRPCDGSVGRKEVTLYIDDARRRMWSPFLQLGVQASDGGAHVHGTMGPQPNLWTAFVFVYAAHLAVCTAGTMYGSIQWMLGDPPTGLAVAGAGLLGLATACGLDLFGRRLGAGQMGILRGAVLQTLPGAGEVVVRADRAGTAAPSTA
jgi:hypothetical protein